MKKIYLLFFLVTIECFAVSPVRTNINNVTTLFQDNVEEKRQVYRRNKYLKDTGINGITSETS
jgi:hypothetical protein